MTQGTPIARRRFWQQLAGVCAGEPPCRQLNDLPHLPPDELFRLIPRLVEGVQIRVEGWQLLALRPGEPPVTISAWQPAEAWLLNQFDGLHTLDDLVQDIMAVQGWSLGTAREFVRAFFIRLALLQIVVPANCPDAESDAS
jgi:hypothetical protein